MAPANRLSDIFLSARREPRLVRCAVLFMDLLGVGAMNRSRSAARHLVELERAVTVNYRDYLSPFSPWPSAFFSDTLVLAAPLVDDRDEAAEVTLLATQAAWLQMSLARAGFFARGGLSIGRFHIREGLVFGPALVDAYELESQVATHPRIVLSQAAQACQRTVLGTSPDGNPLLIRDGDGWTFINYLAIQIDIDTEDPRQPVLAHRDQIVANLQAHRGSRRVWEKYRWVAEYHNEVLRRRLPKHKDLLVPSEPMTWGFAPFA